MNAQATWHLIWVQIQPLVVTTAVTILTASLAWVGKEAAHFFRANAEGQDLANMETRSMTAIKAVEQTMPEANNADKQAEAVRIVKEQTRPAKQGFVPITVEGKMKEAKAQIAAAAPAPAPGPL